MFTLRSGSRLFMSFMRLRFPSRSPCNLETPVMGVPHSATPRARAKKRVSAAALQPLRDVIALRAHLDVMDVTAGPSRLGAIDLSADCVCLGIRIYSADHPSNCPAKDLRDVTLPRSR